MNLIDAARGGNLEECKRLIENGVNHDYDLALRWAAKCGRLEVCKLLIEHGANVNADNSLALRFAILCGHLEVCRLLIEHEVDIKSLITDTGIGVIRLIGKHAFLKAVEDLCDRAVVESVMES